jgi:YHS domain-containing protein
MSADDSRIVKDPICGKDVDTLRARAVGIFGGVTHYFCSQECKAKYVDPRKTERQPSAVSHQPSASEPKKPEPKKPEAKKPEPKTAEAEGEGDEPVRYARSRMRRVTGEVASPVVQIDLSPNKKPSAAPTSAEADEPLEPARSSRGWAWIAIVMLILAGGVIFFTLKHR